MACLHEDESRSVAGRDDALDAALSVEEAREELIAYWKARLAGAPALLELPADHPRSALPSGPRATVRFEIPEGMLNQVRALASDNEATLFMTLLAAFDVVLARYSGQTDVCVFVAERARGGICCPPEQRDTVATNTLVFRLDLEGNPSFLALLSRVREQLLSDVKHPGLSLAQLVETLRPQLSPAYNPLAQVLVIMHGMPASGSATTGVEQQSSQPDLDVARLDLVLRLTETATGIAAELDYATDLFEHAAIERLAAHFTILLGGIIAEPDKPICTLPLMTPVERHHVLIEWNQTASPYPSESCLHQLFEEQVERTPESVALVFGGEQLSYRQLDERGNQLAFRLRELGVGPEVLVGLFMQRSVEAFVSVIGILKAGGVCVPFDPGNPAERLARLMGDARPAVVLTHRSLAHQLPDHSAATVFLDDRLADSTLSSGRRVQSGVTSRNLAYVFFTSGSTGKPKGVMLRHSGLCNMATSLSEMLGTGTSSRVSQLASLSFVASLCEIFSALSKGATLVAATPDENQPGLPLWRFLQRQSVSMATFVPSALAVMPSDPLPELDTITVMGERCPADLVRRWSSGRRFFIGYGATEVSGRAIMWQASAAAEAPLIGRPLHNVRAYVMDEYGQPVPAGHTGELYVGGPGVARGYLNHDELSAERFVADPYCDVPGSRLCRVGDLVRYRPDGNLEYLGRADQQVKLRGYRIELGEISAALLEHPSVASCAITTYEFAPGSPDLVAYVVARSEPPPSAQALRDFLLQKLPVFMVPARYMYLAVLPFTPNGKLDRPALPQPDESEPAGSGTYVPPRTELEEHVAHVFAEVLGLDRIGRDDDFFRLGGHSLLAARAMARLSDLYGLEIPLDVLFTHPTLGAFAEYVDAVAWVQAQASSNSTSAGGAGRVEETI